MSGILEKIAEQNDKIIALLEGGAGAGTTGGKAPAGKGKAPAKPPVEKPNHTKDEVVAAVVAVKDAFGAPAARAITSQFGYAKSAEIQEKDFDAVFDACEEKLAEKASEEEDV